MSDTEHAQPSEHVTAAGPRGFAPGTVSSPFTEAEVAAFREDDKKAAKNFVGLMLAIFVGGVVLYLIVAYICAT